MREGVFPHSTWHKAAPLPRSHARYDDPASRTSNAVPMSPARWRLDLEEVLPRNAVVFSDIGGHMLFNMHHLCMREQQRFVINLGFGSMGHGTLAPIGAGFADPTRPVFALIGDGCFTMNGMDLLTAVEYDVPVIWIVENNNMHGITWHCSKLLSHGRPLEAARYRRPIEIASIARSMGLASWVVDAPGRMQEAVREALRRGGPALIEARVDGSICPPLGERARSLAGFIER
jgi:acetolactate synthase-1/2/3 large subunit